MNANEAKRHLLLHRELLKNPTLQDIFPFIDRAAKMGAGKVFYGVSVEVDSDKLDKLIAELESPDMGYKVKQHLSNGLIALEIIWE